MPQGVKPDNFCSRLQWIAITSHPLASQARVRGPIGIVAVLVQIQQRPRFCVALVCREMEIQKMNIRFAYLWITLPRC
jgi:hypothetical protein